MALTHQTRVQFPVGEFFFGFFGQAHPTGFEPGVTKKKKIEKKLKSFFFENFFRRAHRRIRTRGHQKKFRKKNFEKILKSFFRKKNFGGLTAEKNFEKKFEVKKFFSKKKFRRAHRRPDSNPGPPKKISKKNFQSQIFFSKNFFRRAHRRPDSHPGPPPGKKISTRKKKFFSACSGADSHPGPPWLQQIFLKKKVFSKKNTSHPAVCPLFLHMCKKTPPGSRDPSIHT